MVKYIIKKKDKNEYWSKKYCYNEFSHDINQARLYNKIGHAKSALTQLTPYFTVDLEIVPFYVYSKELKDSKNNFKVKNDTLKDIYDWLKANGNYSPSDFDLYYLEKYKRKSLQHVMKPFIEELFNAFEK